MEGEIPSPTSDPLRVLVLCEGDAETLRSWSGTSKSVVDHLRKAGHEVRTGDVELYGLPRVLGIAASWSPSRFRWWVRYRLSRLPFELRSRRARRHIDRYRGEVDLILQFGATFEPRGHGLLPYALYCDGNARLAERGETGGLAEVSVLTERELREVVDRESRVYEGASKVFTFSGPLTESFIEDFGLPSDRVRTVHAGPNIDPAAVPPPLPSSSTAPPTVLFVGRKFDRKGGDLLLSAFEKVRAEFPDATLKVVGPEIPSESPAGVQFLGFLRKDVPEEESRLCQAYSEADVFCLPTRFEPFGVVFLEAMLHGLPCIGPNAWAVPEMIIDGETGFLVEPENIDDIANAIQTCFRARDRARAMGMAGRKRAIEYFLWDKVVGRIVDGLHEIS